MADSEPAILTFLRIAPCVRMNGKIM